MTKPTKSAEEVLEKIIEKENLTGDAKRFTWAEAKYAMESYKDQCVREACKEQREICVDALIILLEERPDIKIDVLHMNNLVDRITNAPSPL